jgi:hypothetical protein
MSLRPDGATRGDLAEASALVVGGVAMLFLPLIVLMDRMAEGWFWATSVFSVGGAIVAMLGVRWFVTEGPALTAMPASSDDSLPQTPVELPVNVRLVDARNRLMAHWLRFAALASAAFLVAVDLGILAWAVVALFLISFVADHVLLRPQRYVLDGDGLHAEGLLGGKVLPWSEIQAVHWRHYPGKARPPFPGGERLIVEREDADDREFVFHRRYGGTEAELVVRAVLPLLGEKVRSLRPGRVERPKVAETSVASMLEGGEADSPS